MSRIFHLSTVQRGVLRSLEFGGYMTPGGDLWDEHGGTRGYVKQGTRLALIDRGYIEMDSQGVWRINGVGLRALEDKVRP